MSKTRNLVAEVFGKHTGPIETITAMRARCLDRVRLLAPLDDFEIERARARCERLPAAHELATWTTCLETAFRPEYLDDAWLRLAVALILDGLPFAKVENLAVFIDAACFALKTRRVTAPLVATAAQRLWERRRRAPSIAILVDELIQAETEIRDALELVRKTQRLRKNAESILRRAELLSHRKPLLLTSGRS